MATRHISSTVSSNNAPSPTTPRGYDENNFQFPTKAWPTAVIPISPSGSHMMGNSTGIVPLSIQSHSRALSPPTIPISSSPLPPRSAGTGKQNYQQASPGRLSTVPPKLLSLRDGTGNPNSTVVGGGAKGDLRAPALAPRHASVVERPPQQPVLSMSLDSRDAWVLQRNANVSRSGNTTPLRSRDPPSSIGADSQSIQSSTGDFILDHMEPWMTSINTTTEPDDTEQALFEQRLTDDDYGVAVRKIAHNGKSSLRYIRCMYVDASELDTDNSSNRSLSSQPRRFPRFRADRNLDRRDSLLKGQKVRVLIWGTKKEVKLPVDKIICVRKGKTTDRTRRNAAPANRILSLITEDRFCSSLDIEAPTKIDRDKFAIAFSRFLAIPVEGDDIGSVRTDDTSQSWKDPPKSSPALQPQQAPAAVPRQLPKTSSSDHLSVANSNATSNSRYRIPLPEVNADKQSRRPIPNNTQKATISPSLGRPSQQEAKEVTGNKKEVSSPSPLENAPTKGADVNAPSKDVSITDRQVTPTTRSIGDPPVDDNVSIVSSITGVGYDQDLVEELHMALTKMKKELDESRAEAARAVKVAEQAIQSAEKSTSKDWNTTVTHKAAEAAAIAQKRSAEALATARLAEERLEQEKKKAAVWRKQAETATEEAGHWQTKAAVAEVQRAAAAELLESRRQGPQPKSTGTAVEIELDRIRSKLAVESATRRKLLNEVQDLRGNIRVYCRPRVATGTPIISLVSQEVLILHRERASLKNDPTPLGFEFDGILDTDATQQDVYGEVEGVCLSALQGYNSCVMTHGQTGSGKTYTMIGDITYDRFGEVSISNYGIQLQAAQQYFSVLGQRKDQYEDTLTFSIVEVSNERLFDLLAGTAIHESSGVVEGGILAKSRRDSFSQDGASDPDKPVKLEIKTNRDGETSVQGLVSVKVTSFDDFLNIWKESLKKWRRRLLDQGIDFDDHKTNSHMIATFRVMSKNISSGVSTNGKIQFVDLASSNVVPRRSSVKKPLTPESVIEGVGIGAELKYTNRSMATLSEVMTARSQFQRSVPYRNATITHLLSDSLESDTKVVLVTCISSDLKDLQETACALKFAQTARKVVIGKATRHTTNTLV